VKKLDDICEVLRHNLLEISSQCENLRQSIEEFAATVSTYPATMVKVRLGLMNIQVLARVYSLLKEHNRKGYVFLMKSNILLGVHWAEKEFSLNAKDGFRKRGSLILSPEEITELTNKLAEKVDSGQFAQAVDWINRYEPSVINNQVGIG
jgi:hypothetical protein